MLSNVFIPEEHMRELERNKYYWEEKYGNTLMLFNEHGELVLQIVSTNEDDLAVLTSEHFEPCKKVTDIEMYPANEIMVLYYTTGSLKPCSISIKL